MKCGLFISVLNFSLLLAPLAGAKEVLVDDYQFNPAKKVICFMTLNSPDEKLEFKKALPESQFDFVELVHPRNPNLGPVDPRPAEGEPLGTRGAWFEQTCSVAKQKKLQCDALVVSTHFGGILWGNSGKVLDLDTLERSACSEACNGILKKPSAVYTFSCNLLASKGKDKRTPEEYLRILIEDGVPHDRAERVVEARYGPTDDSNEDRTRRIFSNASRIFGFPSTSPQGPEIRASLRRYFSSHPDYLQTLRGYEEEGKSHDVNRVLTGIQNDPFRKLLAPLGLIARSGIAFPGLKSIEEEKVIARNQCALIQGSFDETLALSSRLIREKDYLRYFPRIISLLQSRTWDELTPEQQMIYRSIQNTTSVKNDMRTLLNGPSLPDVHLNWAGLAHSLQWISNPEYEHYVHQSIKKLFTPPVHEATLAEINKHKKLYLPEILSMTASDFSPLTFTVLSGVKALALVAITDKSVQLQLAKTLNESENLRVRILAAETLEAWKPRDPEVLARIGGQLGSPYLEISRAARNLIVGSYSRDSRVLMQLARQWKNQDLDKRLDFLQVLHRLGPTDPAVLREIAHGLRDGNADVRLLTYKTLKQSQTRDPEVIQAMKNSGLENHFAIAP